MTVRRLTIAAALLALGGSVSSACSGPRAARTIRTSELIGSGWAAVAVGVAVVGGKLVRRLVPGRRIRWIVASLLLHPRLWMDAVHGDCGHGLRTWAPVGTMGVALVVALALCWPATRRRRG